MKQIKGILTEILALFVDDGSLVLAVVAWVAGGVLCLHARLLSPVVVALLLAMGIAALLAENVLRTARAHAALLSRVK